ncbi:MAG: DUF2723 domain-containing protein [Hymenobacter sp.]
MLGRLLSLFSFGDVTKVPVLINALSALSSSFTVLFLFWIITRMGRKLLVARNEFETETPEPTSYQTLLILGAGQSARSRSRSPIRSGSMPRKARSTLCRACARPPWSG